MTAQCGESIKFKPTQTNFQSSNSEDEKRRPRQRYSNITNPSREYQKGKDPLDQKYAQPKSPPQALNIIQQIERIGVGKKEKRILVEEILKSIKVDRQEIQKLLQQQDNQLEAQAYGLSGNSFSTKEQDLYKYVPS